LWGKNKEELMKRFVIFLGIALTIAIPATAHAGWMKSYGDDNRDWGMCVQQTTEGDFIITGTNIVGVGQTMILAIALWTLKTDSEGTVLWSKQNPDYLGGNCIRQTQDNGYIMLGVHREYINPHDDILLMKLNPEGDSVWAKVFHGEKDDYGKEIRETSDGGYIIVGSTGIDSLSGLGGGYLWLLKTDSLGDTLHTFSNSSYESRGMWVEETQDSGYVVLGENMWLKFDKELNLLWHGFDFFSWIGDGRCVFERPNGGFVIFGEWFLMTFDAEGEPGDLMGYETIGCAAAQLTEDGDYVVVGNYNGSDVWIEKLDAEFNILWHRTYEGEGYNKWNYVQQTSDGGYIIVGENSVNDGDLWLIKTDSAGMVDVEEVASEPETDWQLLSSIGRQIVLRYEDRPNGFHAQVFDASGRLVDEIHAAEVSGTITWGEGYGCYGSGVYFIKPASTDNVKAQKVIIVQ
jgi:hypothetical protein